MAENKGIRDIQLAELDILKRVLEIFEKENLTYYALGGTLLGAVRHHGFIPWDDDIDVGLPRPDYERFLSVADDYLKKPYEITTLQNGRAEICYYYPRVVNTDVHLLRKKYDKQTIISAWIDVFPLDGVPEERKELDKWYARVKKLRRKFNYVQFPYFRRFTPREGENPTLKRRVHLLLNWCIYKTGWYKLTKKEKIWMKLDEELKKYDFAASTHLINGCGIWGIKELFPKEVYGKGRDYPFEDIMIHGPENYDYVLKQMYGDYMTPPPENERAKHHDTVPI